MDFDRDDTNDTEERYIREALAMLDEGYRKMAKPYIDRLVLIQSLRPSPRMVVTKEQAEAMGFQASSDDPHARAHLGGES